MLGIGPMADRMYDTTLPVRVDSTLLDACHDTAAQDGKTLGEWVRKLLYRATKLEEPPRVPKRQKKTRRKS